MGEKIATMTDFILLGSKSLQTVTEDTKLKDACSLEEKLLTNLNNVLKSRDIAGPYSQSCGFSVVMYGCESWTIKKAESRRTDAFEL